MKPQRRLLAILAIISLVLFANVIARRPASLQHREVTQLSANCHTGRKHPNSHPPLALHSRGMQMCSSLLDADEALSRFSHIFSDILFSKSLAGLVEGVAAITTTDMIQKNAASMLKQSHSDIRSHWPAESHDLGQSSENVDSMWAARPTEGKLKGLCFAKPGWKGHTTRLKTAEVLRGQFTSLPSLLKSISLADPGDFHTISQFETIHDASTFFLVALEALCSRQYPDYKAQSPKQELVHFFGSIFFSRNLQTLLTMVTTADITRGPTATPRVIQSSAVKAKSYLEVINTEISSIAGLDPAHAISSARVNQYSQIHVQMWPDPVLRDFSDLANQQHRDNFLRVSKQLCVPHPSWRAADDSMTAYDGCTPSSLKLYSPQSSLASCARKR